jgi:hypothetical protein
MIQSIKKGKEAHDYEARITWIFLRLIKRSNKYWDINNEVVLRPSLCQQEWLKYIFCNLLSL